MSPGCTVGGEHRLAGPHPVAVAAHGVDLAVVGDAAVGVRQRPRRERVGREAGVHEGERRLEARVGQVGVERLELARREHALVDDRASGQRREVDAELVLDALAQREDATVELETGLVSALGGHEQLPEGRHDTARRRTDAGRIDRDLAPAQHDEALLAAIASTPSRTRAAAASSAGRKPMPTA